MDGIVVNLLQGFVAALSLQNLGACFIGVLVGTVTGVLPGIGPTGAMALLLPLTFGMDAGTGLILLAGIYYGAMYGGSTTSILVNVPGEATSVITCVDGYQMAKKGRAGAALSVAAIGSWFAGTLGIVGLMLFAPPLADLALRFGPPEYFAVGITMLLLLSNLTGGTFSKSLLMVITGVMLSMIGSDLITGADRFTFGITEMYLGIDLLPVIMGLFGLAEVLMVALLPYETQDTKSVKMRELYLTRAEAKRSIGPIIRGSFLGFPLGLIPGPAAFIASLLSYKVEKQVSKHPEEFGAGAIEGVAGPESANNAASSAAMIPLLALGLPFAPPTALLLGGLIVHGISPGPLFITQHTDMFWLVIASMYIGNVMLLILNLPLVGFFAKLTQVHPKVLMPLVAGIMMMGAYSLNNSIFDLWMMIVFGLVGFVMKYADFEPAPLVVGLVLGPVFEDGLRKTLLMMQGNLWMILERPISATLLGISALIIAWVLFKWVRGIYQSKQADSKLPVVNN